MATEVARASRLLAKATAFCLYTGVLVFVTAVRPLRRRPSLSLHRPLRVLITGTFHNPGWLRAHAPPIAATPRVESLVVVTDAPLDPLEKTTYACPPAWLARLFTRAPARLLQVGLSAWRHRSEVLVGYHIMPNALICLVVATLLGRRSVYQMTGGPIQLIGGGGASENALQSRIRAESPLLEKLLLRLVARFDAIVVRGGGAAAFLAERGIADNVSIIPGGIDLTAFQPAQGPRSYDVVFAGRLVLSKGCDLLQEILIRLATQRPGLRAVILGEGPMREEMAAAFAAAGVARNVELPGRSNDVHAWMTQSKVFLLTSPSEGLSIALLEAMCAGAVPVVSDVGELGDVVRNGETGFLVASRRPEDYAVRMLEILDDDTRRGALSHRASEVARGHAGMAAVSRRWEILLDRLSTPAPLSDSRDAG